VQGLAADYTQAPGVENGHDCQAAERNSAAAARQFTQWQSLPSIREIRSVFVGAVTNIAVPMLFVAEMGPFAHFTPSKSSVKIGLIGESMHKILRHRRSMVPKSLRSKSDLW